MSVAVPIRRALSAPPGLRLDQVGPGARRRFATGQGYEHDFTAKPWLPQGFTFTRSGSALAWQGGQYVSKATNEPRIEDLDYLGFPGRKGLLIEGARTNLVQSFADINSWWGVFGSPTRTVNVAAALDGTPTADLVSDLTSFAGIHRLNAGAAATQHAFSAFLAGSGTVQLALYDTDNQTQANLVTLTGSLARAFKIATFGSNADGDRRILIGRFTSGNASSFTCWGMQLEAAAFPSSPIPTAGSTVTRNADTCSRSVVPPSGGFTVGYEWIMPTSPALVFPHLFSFDSGSETGWTGSRLFFNSQRPSFQVLQAGSEVCLLQTPVDVAPGTFCRALFRHLDGAWAMSFNGQTPVKSSATGGSYGATTEWLGSRRSGQQTFCNILRCNASPTRWRPPVSDAQLQALSALS